MGLAILLTLALSAPASAQQVFDPVQSLQSSTGTGLAGTYYHDPTNGQQSLTIDALGSTPQTGNPPYGFTSVLMPLATFSAPNVCFPDCLTATFGRPVFSDGNGGLAVDSNGNSAGRVGFLNGNATNVMYLPGVTPPTTWNNSGLDLNGYLAITQPGNYTFYLGSDDQSSLSLNGRLIDEITGCCNVVSATVTLSAAGLYQIASQIYEFGGGSDLDLTVYNSDTGACYVGCNNSDGNPIDTGLFYSNADLQGAPAPAVGGGWGSFAVLSVIGASLLLRRRFGTA